MSHKISQIIVLCCHKMGIDYKSSNKAYINFEEDAIRLRNIYITLKEISGDLQEISERHNIKELHQLFMDNISAIEKVDHDLLRVAQKLGEK